MLDCLPPEINASILDNMPDGLLVCNREGVIRYLNPALTVITGLTPDRGLGRHILDLFPFSPIMAVMESGVPRMDLPYTLPNLDSHIISYIPTRTQDKKVNGLAAYLRRGIPTDTGFLMELMHGLTTNEDAYNTAVDRAITPWRSFMDYPLLTPTAIRIKSQAIDLAKTDCHVLITGEKGNFKEVVAHGIHMMGSAEGKPFVCSDCARAVTWRSGRFFPVPSVTKSDEAVKWLTDLLFLANGGSLYLDGIGVLPLPCQDLLIQALHTGQVAGSPDNLKFRLIASTSLDLAGMVSSAQFREQLYAILKRNIICLPPLRTARKDIPVIVRHTMRRLGIDDLSISRQAQEILCRYDWPGNTRQLCATLVYASCRCEGKIIKQDDLPPEIRKPHHMEPPMPVELSRIVALAEARAIREAILSCGNNMSAVARRLAISRATLYDKMRKYEINPRG